MKDHDLDADALALAICNICVHAVFDYRDNIEGTWTREQALHQIGAARYAVDALYQRFKFTPRRGQLAELRHRQEVQSLIEGRAEQMQ